MKPFLDRLKKLLNKLNRLFIILLDFYKWPDQLGKSQEKQCVYIHKKIAAKLSDSGVKFWG